MACPPCGVHRSQNVWLRKSVNDYSTKISIALCVEKVNGICTDMNIFDKNRQKYEANSKKITIIIVKNRRKE